MEWQKRFEPFQRPDEDARFIIDDAGGNRVESTNVHWLKYFPPFSLSVVIFATPLFVCGVEKKMREKKKIPKRGASSGTQENVNDRAHMAPSGCVDTPKEKREKTHFPESGVEIR